MIVSVSPQSRASLAAHLGIFPLQMLLHVKYLLLQVFKKLTRFFKSSGVMTIFDTSCSRNFTFIESYMKFMSRYKQNQLFDDEKNKLSLSIIASVCSGIRMKVERYKKPSFLIIYEVKYLKIFNKADKIYHDTIMSYYDKN
ncbi:hypothetical protein Ahy_B06g081712 [Arachis hypogaea]|uniref:Iron hydrogenase large subunit C-terminal domain-containing protein n=1 Tax=Arachis hypogaea TaxID=3818 RepID=A0A444YLP4_ARAHY|nr:hypothetical protein Ahy_B06g081712 [Arachis hypogaea]